MEQGKSMNEVIISQYMFGFTPMAVVKCAIDLEIADILESHGGAMSTAELASTIGCSPAFLRRIMRYLNHRGFFKEEESSYTQTPLSRILLKNDKNSIAPLVMFKTNPVLLAAWHRLSSAAVAAGAPSPFKAANGDATYEIAARDPTHNKLINDAMACHARQTVSQILDRCPEVFQGIGCLVDVGGGDGTAIRAIVKACSWIRGIDFDLPHVVSTVAQHNGDDGGVEYVGGDMFVEVPKADATLIMCVLNNWSDEDCVKILKKCQEAIPKETGKVIIVNAVIGKGEEDKYSDVHLAMDMTMLAYTEGGKERTIEEWDYVVKGAGFNSYSVKDIGAVNFVIQAYP